MHMHKVQCQVRSQIGINPHFWDLTFEMQIQKAELEVQSRRLHSGLREIQGHTEADPAARSPMASHDVDSISEFEYSPGPHLPICTCADAGGRGPCRGARARPCQ